MRLWQPLTVIVLLLLPAGCTWLRPARSPMGFAAHTRLGPGHARGVVVLLPGFGDGPDGFEEHGFLRVLQQHAPEYDVVAADAHFGYYRTGTVVGELQAAVIGPLLVQGYRGIWLAGVSMGGHGAIGYARAHPEKIAGLLLFAPYMGPKDVVATVTAAGGLCQWGPPQEFAEGATGFAQANFAWLKQTACQPGAPVSLWLAVGDADRLLPADRLLGDVLAREQFLILPGGHGWNVWTPALEQLTSRSLARR